MPERFLLPCSEAALALIVVVVGAASKMLLYESEAEAVDALRWLLLPLIGSLLAAGGAIMFNPRPEHRKIVFARSIWGVVLGTALPKLTSMLHPWIAQMYVEPSVLLLAGFGLCTGAYILSRPLVQKVYDRADRLADQGLDELERRAGLGRSDSNQSNTPQDKP
jgi:hypothetical protein